MTKLLHKTAAEEELTKADTLQHVLEFCFPEDFSCVPLFLLHEGQIGEDWHGERTWTMISGFIFDEIKKTDDSKKRPVIGLYATSRPRTVFAVYISITDKTVWLYVPFPLSKHKDIPEEVWKFVICMRKAVMVAEFLAHQKTLRESNIKYNKHQRDVKNEDITHWCKGYEDVPIQKIKFAPKKFGKTTERLLPLWYLHTALSNENPNVIDQPPDELTMRKMFFAKQEVNSK